MTLSQSKPKVVAPSPSARVPEVPRPTSKTPQSSEVPPISGVSVPRKPRVASIVIGPSITEEGRPATPTVQSKGKRVAGGSGSGGAPKKKSKTTTPRGQEGSSSTRLPSPPLPAPEDSRSAVVSEDRGKRPVAQSPPLSREEHTLFFLSE